MKKTMLFLVLIVTFISLNAQQNEKIIKLVDVEFKLNSSFFGALLKPKEIFKITLPKNTTSWNYIFGTSLNNSNSEIFTNISKAMLSTAATYYSGGIASIAVPNVISKFPIPTGESSVSIYLLDQANATAFLNNNDFQPYQIGMIENKSNGEKSFNDIEMKDFYIGVKNTSSFQRQVHVNLQVYAVVNNGTTANNIQNPNNGWNMEVKKIMYNKWYNEALKLGIDQIKAKEIATQTQKEITSRYTYGDFQQLGAEKWSNVVYEIFNKIVGKN